MTHILSCINLKGGVGKTAIAVNFAAYCGKIGKKTLLIDLDPQTNATFSCITVEKWKEHAEKKGTIADIFGVRRHTSAEDKIIDLKEIILSNVFKNVDLIPSHLDLFTIDLDMASTTARERKLARSILPFVKDNYEIVVCDCPPNLTIPTQNAIALSSHFIVPISPDFLSALGVGILLSRINQLVGDLEHKIIHLGIVISRVGRPALYREKTVATIRQEFKDLVFKTELKERASVSQAVQYQKSVFEMGDNNADEEFSELSKEILNKLGVK